MGKHQESKKLEKAFRLLALAEGYWTLFCEATDLAANELSSQTPASADLETMRLRLRRMHVRAIQGSSLKLERLQRMEHPSSRSETSPPKLSLIPGSESLPSELDQLENLPDSPESG